MIRSWFIPFSERLGMRRQQQLPKRTLLSLMAIFLVALLSNFLANDPQKSFFPPLIPYSAKKLDAANSPFFSPFSTQNIPSVYQRHWLGTDELGRDVTAGLIAGTQTALLIGVGGVLLALFIGLPIGLAAGYYGGLTDQITMRLVDILLAFPWLLLAIGIVAILGPGINNVIIAVAIIYVPACARIVRASVLSIYRTTSAA